MSRKLPLDKFIMSAQYDEAGRYQNRFRFATVIGFFIGFIISLLSIEELEIIHDPNIIIIIIIISTGVIFYGHKNKSKFKQAHSKAEKLRKKDFIRKVLDSDLNHEEDSYIYYDINDAVIEKAKRMAEKNNDKDNNEYFTVLESHEGKIIESIQQNCNQTSINLLRYYQELSKTRIPLLTFFTAILGILLIYLFINIEDEALKIARIFIAFISIYFSIDIFSYFKSYKDESEVLKRLDKEIGRIKEGISFAELMYYFSEYNSILETKPIVPYRIYEKNKEIITEEWKERLLKEKRKREANEQRTN